MENMESETIKMEEMRKQPSKLEGPEGPHSVKLLELL